MAKTDPMVFRIDSKLKKSLKKAARDRHLSLGAVIRKAVERYVGTDANDFYKQEAETALRKYLSGIEDSHTLRKTLGKEERLKLEKRIADAVEQTLDKFNVQGFPLRTQANSYPGGGETPWNGDELESETLNTDSAYGGAGFAPSADLEYADIPDNVRRAVMRSLGLPTPDDEGDELVEGVTKALRKFMGPPSEGVRLNPLPGRGATLSKSVTEGLRAMGIETELELRKDSAAHTLADHAAPAFVLTSNGARVEPLNKSYKTREDSASDVRTPRILRKSATGRDTGELKKLAKSIASGPDASGASSDAVHAMFSKLRKA